VDIYICSALYICSAHQSEALPVQETQREEIEETQSWEIEKRHLAHQLIKWIA